MCLHVYTLCVRVRYVGCICITGGIGPRDDGAVVSSTAAVLVLVDDGNRRVGVGV